MNQYDFYVKRGIVDAQTMSQFHLIESNKGAQVLVTATFKGQNRRGTKIGSIDLLHRDYRRNKNITLEE